MNKAEYEKLPQDLREIVDSDRQLAEQRRDGVIPIRAIRLRRERVAAANARWGVPLRGDGPARGA